MGGPPDPATPHLTAARRERRRRSISELEGTRGPRAITMTEAANGKARTTAGERTTGEFPHSIPGVRTEVVVFENSGQMVQSLGSHDEALRFIESQYPGVDFHVRGNELSISGPPADVPRIMRLLNEVRGLVARGTVITPAVLQQLVSMLRSQSLQNPVEVLTLNILSSRGKTIRPKTLNQKNYVDAIDANTVIFGIGWGSCQARSATRSTPTCARSTTPCTT